MYINLPRLLKEKNISMKAYASFLGISERTLQNKAHGQSDFTMGEAIKTCTIIFPEYKMDYVFKKEEPLAEVGSETGALAAAGM